MDRFLSLFPRARTNLIGMIHAQALPGSPKSGNMSVQQLIDRACVEAETYARAGGIDAVIVENMHDVPYLRAKDVGPETVAAFPGRSGSARAAGWSVPGRG